MRLFLSICMILIMIICRIEGTIRMHDDGSVSSNSGAVSMSKTDRDSILTSKSRSKRDESRLVTAYSFRDEDIQLLVDDHNRFRRLVPATDMQKISWDSNLASSAQAHANQCTFSHSTNRQNTGENIYASPFSNYRGAIKMWFDEVYDQNCACTNFYKHCCGHYTQVAWASTTKVGCGLSKCNNILYLYNFHYVLVCHYSPAGNIVYFSNGEMIGRGGFTYKKNNEAACSGCPNGYKCDDGLCT